MSRRRQARQRALAPFWDWFDIDCVSLLFCAFRVPSFVVGPEIMGCIYYIQASVTLLRLYRMFVMRIPLNGHAYLLCSDIQDNIYLVTVSSGALAPLLALVDLYLTLRACYPGTVPWMWEINSLCAECPVGYVCASIDGSAVLCSPGKWCPMSSAVANSCPPGTFGSTTGLGTAACSGLCDPGFWCGAGSVIGNATACRNGQYGASPGLGTAQCTGACAAGYFCPPASTSATQFECPDSSVYCPAASESPRSVTAGYFSYPVGHGAIQQNVCPESGSYCLFGVKYACPAGSYGNSTMLSTPACTSLCDAGCACASASSSSCRAPCGDASVYCPAGTPSPLTVDPGWYSAGGADASHRTGQIACPVGSYCVRGIVFACPEGTYGARQELSSPLCTGRCADGFLCPAASSSPRAVACSPGGFCMNGTRTDCPQGTYNALNVSTARINCTACAAGSYNAYIGQQSASSCLPCAPTEHSNPGSRVCSPGIVSVVASNQLVPGLSVGDVITMSFSKATNAPQEVAANITSFLQFSSRIASALTASWSSDATTLTVKVDEAFLNFDMSATRIGALFVSFNASMAITAAGGSDPGVFSPIAVTGTWGAASAPEFAVAGGAYAPSYARNTGGQAGLGVGDSIVLRFGTPCKPVSVANKSDIDVLLRFSSPIGRAYTGQWEVFGTFAFAELVVTVTEPLASTANLTAAGVGFLNVSVLAPAGMTSLDESSPPSTATTVIEIGTWGEVPRVSAIQRSYRALRVTISPPPTVVRYGWTPDSYELDWTSNTTGGNATGGAVWISNLHPDGAAVYDLVGVPPGRPVQLRAAARAKVLYAGEVLAKDELGPFAAAQAAFVTKRPVITSVSIGGSGAEGSTMATGGAQIVTIRGMWLGIDTRDINVSCTNGRGINVNATGCTVTTPNEMITCLTSPGVGYGYVWSIGVDGVFSSLPDITYNFSVPTILSSARIAGANGTDTFEVYGRDFGPVGTTVDRAFLYSPSDAAIEFDAAECNVSVADTTIVCSIPDGAGSDLLWSVVIGGQKSTARTVAYAVPEIRSVACWPSRCDNLGTTGGDTIVLSGVNFGPATLSPNFLAGVYGGVYLVASTGTRFALAKCNVTVSQVQAECFSPPGFGVGLSLFMTVLRQDSAPVIGAVSFALPVVSLVGIGTVSGGALLVKGNVVTVTGKNLGAPGFLLLNKLPVVRADFEAGHRRLVFKVDVLPQAVIGVSNVSVSVSLQGIESNSLWLDAAAPAISSTFPLSILDDRPAVVCLGVTAVYWVVLSGSNFGLNSSTTSLSAVGMTGTSPVCSITDTTGGGSALVFGTNASVGSLKLVMGQLSSASVNFSAHDLLKSPTVSTLQNATSGLQPITKFRTSGGEIVRIIGNNFHASDLVFLAPLGVSDAGTLPADARFALSVCSTTTNGITQTEIRCIVPPGVGSHRVIALFARGMFVSNTDVYLAYSAPSVTRISVLSGARQLGNPGGRVSIQGTSFGTHAANVTVRVGGMLCPIVGTVGDTGFECNAPASDDGSPPVEVNVGGQSTTVVGLLAYAPPLISRIDPTTSRTIGTVSGDNMFLDIYGTDFGANAPTVMFVLPAPLAPVRAVVQTSTQTSIRVAIPQGASGSTNVSIEVGNTKRSARLNEGFEYLPPMIASVSPPIEAHGCSVDGCALTIHGDNFGSPEVLGSLAPAVMVNGASCVVHSFEDSRITCNAPHGSGVRNTVTVRLLNRTAVLSGTAFAYSAPVVSYALPPIVDQHVTVPLLLMGTNFASTGLAISISGVLCSTPAFINSSAVACREAQFLAIGRASIVVSVNGQVSNVATAVAECRTGYFGRSGDGACMPCPTHAWCAGQDADPLAQAGYWQSGRTSFVACVPPAACMAGVLGSNGSICADAYTGVECRVCSNEHFRSGADCVPCPKSAWILVVLFTAGVVCIGGLAAWMHRKMFNIKGLTIGVDMMQASNCDRAPLLL